MTSLDRLIKKNAKAIEELTESIGASRKSAALSEDDIQDIVNTAAPCLVKIVAPDRSSYGTGFIISEDGFVLTAYHVCRGKRGTSNSGGSVAVIREKQSDDGRVIEREHEVFFVADLIHYDVSLLKMKRDRPFPFLHSEFRSRFGSPVVLAGFGLPDDRKDIIVSNGIISSCERPIRFVCSTTAVDSNAVHNYAGAPVLSRRPGDFCGVVHSVVDQGQWGYTAIAAVYEEIEGKMKKFLETN